MSGKDGDQQAVGKQASFSMEGNVIMNELLCFVQFHMKRSVITNIVEVISRYYSWDEISFARELLINHYGDCVGLGQILKNRRTTTGKQKCVTCSEDIVNALHELDANGIITNFVARNLGRLPKCDPKDIDPYTAMQMIFSMEERIKTVEDNLSEARAHIINQEENLKCLSESVKTQEVIITNSLPSSPSYSDMVSAGIQNVRHKNDLSTANSPPRKKSNNPNRPRPTKKQAQGGGDTVGIPAEVNDSDDNTRPWTLVGKNGKPEVYDSDDNTRPWTLVGKNGKPARDARKSSIYQKQHNPNQGGQQKRQPVRGRQRTKIHGSNNTCVVVGAPPPKRDYFLSRIVKTTEEDVLRKFIEDSGIGLVGLRLVSNENAKFKSYKLSVILDDKDKILSPDLWPKGSCIEKWRPKNNVLNPSQELNNGGST